MKDSLKKLMDMFPWFFDKSETSNFHKSQDVTNRRFQELDNDLFKIHESFHLNKRLLVWRDQVERNDYMINFVANFPNLKSVTLYKNDEVIYTDSFTYEEDVNSFEYSYNHSTLDDNYDDSVIIPPDSFRIIAETWDEYILEKGYPENDIAQGNVFDHDRSLDVIGESNDIPRKEYLIVTPDLYPATEPPYNNRASEDDYHYMKRMITYAEKLHTTPAPVLEIWKLYGIESRMENRERLLLKVFDENKHDGLEWTPMPWEHKDQFCKYSQIKGVYFFVDYSTNTPTKRQNIVMDFRLVDSYGDNIADDTYRFDIYLNNNPRVMGLNSLTYKLPARELEERVTYVVRVDCHDASGAIVGSVEFYVRVIGCDDADFFVSTSGSDSNDGKTRATAFATMQKACNSLESDNSLISVLAGNYTINSTVSVPYSCLIMACGDVLIENTTDNRFFNIPVGKQLDLQDFRLKYDADTQLVGAGTWVNNNDEECLTVVTHSVDEYVYVITSPLIKNLSYDDYVISYETVIIEELSDLDGVIYDLKFEDHEIKYKEFNYVSDDLTTTDLDNLRKAVTSLRYIDNKIKYTVLGDEI